MLAVYSAATLPDQISVESCRRFFVPITMEMDYIEFDMLNTFRHLYKPKNATPQAMPRAIFQNFRIFQNFSPRRRLRLRLQANKNLHMSSGYALSILLHNICPQAMPKFAYAKFLCL
ncbi:hypothetical protein T4B_3295 [Trichinella pseudospiralis]|uniref:Uncharacterized protein n=1 Tax=Trichinella pseudospiralis TaxID=6337 RepID=A0A0V1GP85_TRIPS|nr:hypothetical protein T4B_3295 [Trichinella pseudospiralis]